MKLAFTQSLLAVSLLTLSGPVLAQAPAKKTVSKNVLSCEQMGEGEENEQLLTLEVTLDKAGKPIAMHAVNPVAGDAKAPKLDWTLGKGATFSRKTVKNRIEGEDENGKPAYAFGIENVDLLEGRDAAGKSISLILNDHTYSGYPGSSIIIKGKGVMIEVGGPCDGPGAAIYDPGQDL